MGGLRTTDYEHLCLICDPRWPCRHPMPVWPKGTREAREAISGTRAPSTTPSAPRAKSDCGQTLDAASTADTITVTYVFRCDMCSVEWRETRTVPREVIVLDDDAPADWRPRRHVVMTWEPEASRCAACVAMAGEPDDLDDDLPDDDRDLGNEPRRRRRGGGDPMSPDAAPQPSPRPDLSDEDVPAAPDATWWEPQA